MMAQIRQEFLQYRSTHWRSRILRLFSKVELGTATVGAIPSEPKVASEVIPRGYRASQLLTAAFHRLDLLPENNMICPTLHRSLIVRLATTPSLIVGPKIIVFRTTWDGPVAMLHICLVAFVAVALGFLCGCMTSNAELGVAVAAAWIQFVQIIALSRQHQGFMNVHGGDIGL